MSDARIGVPGPAATALVLAAVLSTQPGPAASGTGEALALSSEFRVSVRQGREVALEVRAAAADGWETLAERFAGDRAQAEVLARLNGPATPGADRWVRVPVTLLAPSFRSLVLRNLFPGDRHDGQDWIHSARSGVLPTYDEGLWQVAEWFSSGGDAFADLMSANDLSSPELREGQTIRIPASMLHPAFRARMRSDDGALEFDSDREGPFAAYRLKAGEALYSAVVVRFTGRTGADDVRETADKLLARSGIRDVRDIPVGYEVKVPLELLEPEHLPQGHPRRREAEEQRAALADALAERPLAGTRGGLEGVVVIIDPGHGGRDLGTINNGVWEHDYVYDVACRLKRMLETETAASVVMTLEDKETGCVPSTGDRLVANKQGTILTTPAFLARNEGEAKIGVNLRWYLANSVYRKTLRDGSSGDRIVFVSLHADSRHPGLRGLMVYVPGAGYRTRTYGHSAAPYDKYAEVREKPTIRFSKTDRVRSEAVSRNLAEAIVSSFRQSGLPVQPYHPVREKVIRGKQQWVPAVLRGNAVPAKVLVEMLNLSNRDDAKLLGSARRREQLARAIEGGLFKYFGERPTSAASTTAAQ